MKPNLSVKFCDKELTNPLILASGILGTEAELLARVARAGADVVSATNTLNSMIIDIESGKPVLANKMGGISGPAIKPVAIRCVYQIAKVCKIPIIGLGGITYGKDAIEMIMAGATAIGVGSAIYYRGIDVFLKISKEIEEFMINHEYKSLKEFRGIAHEN